MIYILWKSILLGRYAFSHPKGFFEGYWCFNYSMPTNGINGIDSTTTLTTILALTNDSTIVSLQQLRLENYVLSHRKISCLWQSRQNSRKVFSKSQAIGRSLNKNLGFIPIYDSQSPPYTLPGHPISVGWPGSLFYFAWGGCYGGAVARNHATMLPLPDVRQLHSVAWLCVGDWATGASAADKNMNGLCS